MRVHLTRIFCPWRLDVETICRQIPLRGEKRKVEGAESRRFKKTSSPLFEREGKLLSSPEKWKEAFENKRKEREECLLHFQGKKNLPTFRPVSLPFSSVVAAPSMNNYGEGRCFCCCEEEVRRGLLFWTVKTDEPNEEGKMGHTKGGQSTS